MRCLVTGCAGFIGSHLVDRLLADGHEVVGVDALTDYYSPAIKVRNMANARTSGRFQFLEADLSTVPLGQLLEPLDIVFHLAAQAGVRSSWGAHFQDYTRHNILGTQRLLEAARGCNGLRRFVYASSSSIYGNANSLPMSEETLPRPASPYGVTKLAGEHLCNLYHETFGVKTVALRFFTVYGARQRPDMAFFRFIRASAQGESITVYDDGRQTRDFTHVSDVVSAVVRSAEVPAAVGRTYNIAGGSRVSLREALKCLGDVVGRDLAIEYRPKQAGDVRDTYADIRRAQKDLGYQPTFGLRQGLLEEVEWFMDAIGREAESAPA